jgi:hypothetical protein
MSTRKITPPQAVSPAQQVPASEINLDGHDLAEDMKIVMEAVVTISNIQHADVPDLAGVRSNLVIAANMASARIATRGIR